jgi:hypothetical protein
MSLSVTPKQWQMISPSSSSSNGWSRKCAMAFWSASMPITEQCIFSSGSPPRYLAMSWFVTLAASSIVMPRISSINASLEAIALAQPAIRPSSSSLIISRSASPHVMLPTVASRSGSAISPACRGFRK